MMPKVARRLISELHNVGFFCAQGGKIAWSDSVLYAEDIISDTILTLDPGYPPVS